MALLVMAVLDDVNDRGRKQSHCWLRGTNRRFHGFAALPIRSYIFFFQKRGCVMYDPAVIGVTVYRRGRVVLNTVSGRKKCAASSLIFS